MEPSVRVSLRRLGSETQATGVNHFGKTPSCSCVSGAARCEGMAVFSVTTFKAWWRRAGPNRLLILAFVVSLSFHGLTGATYYVGKKFGWWQRLQQVAFFRSSKMLTDLLRKAEPPKPPEPRLPDLPLVFVEVNPAQATVEPPKDAKFYSSQNSQAANPDAEKDTETPKISGKQEQVVKTEDVPRDLVPLQPTMPLPPAKEEQEEAKPRPAQPPGDLAMTKPSPNPPKETGEATRPRPRTIKEALARKEPSQAPGEKIKQEGGVRRRLEIASLDAKGTVTGSYDSMLIQAISQRWYSLLDQRDYASDSRGKVVLQFRLHQDGRVTEMSVAENSAGEVLSLICQKAVLDPAPFAAWPIEMRRLLGETRTIQFTFYYN